MFQFLGQVSYIFWIEILKIKNPLNYKSLQNKKIIFFLLLATGIARSISPGQVLRNDSNSSPMATGSSNVATIIRAHSVQNPPQPPVKKSTFGSAVSNRVAPPIPPNKPVINKNTTTTPTAATTTNNSNRAISFLQSTVSGASSAAQAIAAQNAAKDGEE